MNDLRLAGCTPEPIGAYLKALGVLRLVAEQADPDARGWWRGEYFYLRTRLDEETLLRFFLHDYAPTPIIAPWNGGSGFYPKDNDRGIGAIERDNSVRFAAYRAAIATARQLLNVLGISAKPTNEDKDLLIARLRDELADDAVAWLDAALVLTPDGTRYPPLLGTGGNDGRLDFTNNQMQRLTEVLVDAPVEAEPLLRAALFGETAPGMYRAAVGQFAPGQAGGANSAPGYGADARVNPWDFILLLEGALLFSASVTRRLESARPGALAFPFSVRSTSAGYGSASDSDEGKSRHELWVPLWQSPAQLHELRALMSEGRAHVGTRPVANGVDFARAVASLAVDRGISSFARYGFHVRNGLSYFATPLERWDVARTPGTRAMPLQPLDPWLDRLRSGAQGKNAPASIRTAQRNLDRAIMELCRADRAAALQDVLIALGAVDQALARSNAFTDKARIPPVPQLAAAWLQEADDESVEFRLAAALAGTGIREFMIPYDGAEPYKFQRPGNPRVVWGAGSLVQNLIAVIRRREIDRAQQPAPDGEPNRHKHTRAIFARLGDIESFVEGEVDDGRIEALLRGLVCVAHVPLKKPATSMRRSTGGGLFALLKLVHDRDINPDLRLPPCPEAFSRAASGDALRATEYAIRRLRASGLPPIPTRFGAPSEVTRRAAAALLFPISEKTRAGLLAAVIVPNKPEPLEPEVVS